MIIIQVFIYTKISTTPRSRVGHHSLKKKQQYDGSSDICCRYYESLSPLVGMSLVCPLETQSIYILTRTHNVV